MEGAIAPTVLAQVHTVGVHTASAVPGRTGLGRAGVMYFLWSGHTNGTAYARGTYSRVHTQTHTNTPYIYSVAVGRDTNRHVQPTVSSCGCCFDQELLLLVEGDICVQNHRGLPIVSLDLALLLQAVDGLHPNALPLP